MKNFFIPNILVLLVVAFLVRILLSPFGTLSLDANTFVAWGTRLASVGFSKFYFGTWSDYLPGYLYILSLLGGIAKTHIIPQVILYKLPAIISDVVTGYLIYKIILKLKSKRWALMGAVVYLFNPALIANSTLWGQVDSLTALFSLLTIWSIEFNPFLSSVSLAVGTLIKPQMGVISLIALFLMIRDKRKIKDILIYVLTAAGIFVLGFLPFSGGTNLFGFIFSRLNLSLNQYPYTSVNAFNFWGIFGTWRPDAGLNVIGFIAIVVLFFGFGLRFLKRQGGEYILLSFLYAISFVFMTRMHERHLLPVFAPLTIAATIEPVFILVLVGYSFTYIANLYWVWNWVANNFMEVFGSGIVKAISLVNLLLVGVFMIPEKVKVFLTNFEGLFIRGSHLNTVVSRQNDKRSVLPTGNLPKFSTTKIRMLFVGVIIFAAITRFYNLPNPNSHYFDEVYHAFTAQNMLRGVTRAWEWWNPNPNGFAYEWTHPPLAKEGMVIGMTLLGENSFGYRFPGALLGVLSIILVFFITRFIFDDELIALLASFCLALDGLFLVMTRIAMNDSYVVFFILLSIYLFLKEKNIWSAIAFGFAIASKWSAVSSLPILLVLHFLLKRKIKWTYVFFFVIPVFIYISCYFPIFTNKQIQNEYIANTYYNDRVDYFGLSNPLGKTGIVPLDMFLDTQKQMWWYHTNLKATHPYSSLWYTWPFNLRPIYLYTSNEINGQIARIYAMGNPIVFWFGVFAVFLCGYFALIERNRKLGFIVFCYFIFFAMWAISPRIMFLYHYLPSVPFMCIATAYILRRFPRWIILYLVSAFILFVYFYSHWAGLSIPVSLDSSYYWFTSWR